MIKFSSRRFCCTVFAIVCLISAVIGTSVRGVNEELVDIGENGLSSEIDSSGAIPPVDYFVDSTFNDANDTLVSDTPDSEFVKSYDISVEIQKEDIPDFENDLAYIYRTLIGEVRPNDYLGIAACVCAIWNRYDDSRWPSTISEIITQRGQFCGYWNHVYDPVDKNSDYYRIALDVTIRHYKIINGENVLWVLPIKYQFWHGDGVYNHFTDGKGHKYDLYTSNNKSAYENLDNLYSYNDLS